jgi:predicted aspartyl protease
MGHVRVTVRISNAERPELTEELTDVLIDTGASWTVVPRELARRLELRGFGEATGRAATGVQTLEQSYAHIEIEGKSGVSPILISDTLDIVHIGVLTLEALALAVDPLNQRLIESEILLL